MRKWWCPHTKQRDCEYEVECYGWPTCCKRRAKFWGYIIVAVSASLASAILMTLWR